MREILFRGKRIDNGEWAYGFVIHSQEDDSWAITNETEYLYDVDGNTVGQYTGLTDKNGVKIFEGDIIRATVPKKGGVYGFEVGAVEFHKSAFSVAWMDFLTYGRNFVGYISDIEVIGNIHDNPELLEEEP